MEYVKLGRTGLEVSRICLGCMSYGVPDRGIMRGARRGGEPAVHQARSRGRHQFLRHGEPIFARQQRGDPRPGDQGFHPPRRGRDRDQGLWADAAGTQRRWPVAQGDHARDRRQPAAPRHRLRRLVPDPPLGLRHTDRRDARSAARHRQSREGPLHRRVLDVCVAIRPGSRYFRAPRLDALCQHAELGATCSIARRSARCCHFARPKGSASFRGARKPVAA